MTARHLANLAPELHVLGDAAGEAVEPFGDDLAGTEGERLGALVDLDAGERAGGLDELGQRRAVLGLLADGLVVEDDAGDVALHRLGRAEQHLAIGAAVVLGVLGLDAVEALGDGAGALVGGQDALARRHHGLRHLFECHCHRCLSQGSLSLRPHARTSPWHSADATPGPSGRSPQRGLSHRPLREHGMPSGNLRPSLAKQAKGLLVPLHRKLNLSTGHGAGPYLQG